MKKLLLAPFLLTSLISFSGELKAHPTRMDSSFKATSKTPAQVRNDTKFLAVFGAHFEEGVQSSPYFELITMPFKTQQACTRQSELLVNAFRTKFDDRIVLDYHCMKVNR